MDELLEKKTGMGEEGQAGALRPRDLRPGGVSGAGAT